jgi:hypothetical protein
MAGRHRADDKPPAQTPAPKADPASLSPAVDLDELDEGRWYIVRLRSAEGLAFDFRDQYLHRDGFTLHFKSHTINTRVTRVEEVGPV